MLKRSSGLSSPSNAAPPNALVGNPDDGPEDDIPLNLDSGSPPLRSYISRFCGSVPKLFMRPPVNIAGQSTNQKGPEMPWRPLDRVNIHIQKTSQREDILLKASSAPGAPFLSGCNASANYVQGRWACVIIAHKTATHLPVRFLHICLIALSLNREDLIVLRHLTRSYALNHCKILCCILPFLLLRGRRSGVGFGS